jgi:NADPH2:quinone reductase
MTITNKAAVIEEPGKLVVKEIPIPNAKDDSIVTKNALAGVNFADNSQVSGELSVTNSNILGFEGYIFKAIHLSSTFNLLFLI